jgi:festuclavine dehydrogenase
MPSRVEPDPKSQILVIGGTGTVGSRIVNQLAAASIPAIVASRSGEAPENEYLTGVKFDWFDKTTHDAPFEAAGEPGIRAVYIIAPPVIDSAPLMKAFINHALEKGTRRFVLQSATPIEAGSDAFGMGQVHSYLRDLGNQGKADWCALRPTWFQGRWPFSPTDQHGIRGMY